MLRASPVETLGRQKRSICTGPGAGQGLSFLRNSMQVSTSKCVLVSVTSLIAVRSHLEGWVSWLCAGWERVLLGLARLLGSRLSQEVGSQSPEIVEPKQDKHLFDKVLVRLGLSVYFRHSTKIHTNKEGGL